MVSHGAMTMVVLADSEQRGEWRCRGWSVLRQQLEREDGSHRRTDCDPPQFGWISARCWEHGRFGRLCLKMTGGGVRHFASLPSMCLMVKVKERGVSLGRSGNASGAIWGWGVAAAAVGLFRKDSGGVGVC